MLTISKLYLQILPTDENSGNRLKELTGPDREINSILITLTFPDEIGLEDLNIKACGHQGQPCYIKYDRQYLIFLCTIAVEVFHGLNRTSLNILFPIFFLLIIRYFFITNSMK